MVDLKRFTIGEVDVINKPPHYNMGSIETIDYIIDVLEHNENLDALDGYYIGNVIKYLSVRLGNKSTKLEDVKKAQYYLNRLVEKLEVE